MPLEHAPGALALRQVVNGVGDELAQLAVTVERLQDALAGQPAAEGPLEALQCLDLMAQSLMALSGFLALTARGLEPDLKIDLTAALATIKIGQVAARLAMNGAAASQPAAGCFELFADG